MADTDVLESGDLTDLPYHRPKPPKRLELIDLLRGLVLVLMVLDHTRTFMHKDAFSFDPLDLTKTTPLLFFVRWTTHLCAPTFAFLAGVSIFMQSARGKSGLKLSAFLLTRGLWLIFLELTLIDFGWSFSEPYVFLQVIWALGASMIFMAAFTLLPGRSVLILGILITVGHGLLDGIHAKDLSGTAQILWRLFMEPGGLGSVPGYLLYPVMPWLGIMCLGYGIGPLFDLDELRRKRALEILLVAFIAAFLLLRLPNLYGDPVPWVWKANPSLTALSVLNISKYPPSLDFTLLTLGLALFLGLSLQRLPGLFKAPLLAFGRTPLLTYSVHLYLIHGMALVLGVMRGLPAADFFSFEPDSSRAAADGWGLPLWQVILVWIAVLVVLYPISRAYATYKAKHDYWWLSYI